MLILAGSCDICSLYPGFTGPRATTAALIWADEKQAAPRPSAGRTSLKRRVLREAVMGESSGLEFVEGAEAFDAVEFLGLPVHHPLDDGEAGIGRSE